MQEAPLRSSAALIAYAEPYIAGRRVLVLGDATSPLAEQLLDRGARLVHMYDPDPVRVAEAATRNTESRVTLAPLSEGGLASREGAFDCALIEDLSSLPNRTSALRALRRALGARGVALIAAPNPDVERRLLGGAARTTDVDYYGLYDAVSAELEHVRMLGQTPFVGYAVVDFALDKEPEPSFDSSFVPGGAEEPEQYIALASMQEITLDEMMIVQLPLSGLRQATADDGALAVARAAERKASKRVVSLEAELRRVRQSGKELEQLRNELEQRDSWIKELESRAATADARADAAETELESLRDNVQELTLRLSEAEAKAAGRVEAAPSVSEDQEIVWREQLEEAQRAVARAERERAWAEERVSELQEELDKAVREAEEGARADQKNALDSEIQRLKASLGDQKASFERLSRLMKQSEEALELRNSELAELKKELSKREQLWEQKLEKAERGQEAESGREVRALEEQLLERGRHVAELEAQLRKLERYGRTLVAELAAVSESHAGSTSLEEQVEELQRQLEHLASLHTGREADLVAAEWVIAELRDKLTGGPPPQVNLRLAQDGRSEGN